MTVSPPPYRSYSLRPALSRSAFWIRLVGFCSFSVLSACSHLPQPKGLECDAAGLAAEEGVFSLSVGQERWGLPASNAAFLRPGNSSFDRLIASTQVQSSLASRAQPLAAATLPAARSHSRSALVGAKAPLFVEEVEWKGSTISYVMYQAPMGETHPVAAAVVDRSRWRSTRVSLLALSSPAAKEAGAAVEVARLEHLYTIGFRQEANARFCLVGDCESEQLLSQAEALQQIAQRRECVAAALPASVRTTVPGWRIVTLRPQEVLPGDNSVVTVRVSDQAGPLSGVQVMFTKPPHAACTATSRADGTATCQLADNYGHAGGHPEFDREPVVATFPGNLKGNPILLPTTQLLRPPKAPEFTAR
ncbi:hypothetical protein V4F39_01275 [Aquincola sp. MAHUQ-54]|uniref:Big-1 domain-containing protein n=1 Tax=Aquincola agrisoli TaxID=3119538 RepID=A0AAW9PYD6_9BURK